MRTLGMAVIVGLVVGCGGMARKTASPAAYAQPGYPSSDSVAAEAAPSGGVGVPPGSPGAIGGMPAPEAPAPPKSEARASTTPVATPPPPPPPRETRPLPQAGQLTAGVWDDNRNFEFWKPYAIRFTERGSDFAMFTTSELEAARAEASRRHDPRTELDIQLVLDTTGSMGDELSYLQSEFDAIATQVRAKFPNVTPRWSLVVYRDHGDDYVTRGFDFTTDTNHFRANLRAQRAVGGGDTPEAVVEGLSTGLAQHWRAAPNVAKIAFWVADAPAHPGEGKKLASALAATRDKGIHVYPVASSDADETAEYQMRSAAQITSGRYIFLTNDSGIGNAHAEPHIPCYNVSRLDHAIVRMIEVEMSGSFVEADARQVIRSVGRPNKEGKCQLSSGMLVASY
ncbi:MAG: VWA domain-containing protein [Labilithrix sp.]|nr:VWA domain-containing protein [Labilithrix sp.]